MTFYATDARVRKYGRVYTQPDNPNHLFIPWTYSGFTVTFSGTSLLADMACTAWNNDSTRAYITVIVDGDEANRLVLALDKEGLARYTLVDGLSDTTHTVTVLKQSEALQSNWEVGGLYLNEGGQLLETSNTPAKWKFEFIGDSITAGFGNRCPTKDGPFCTKEQDGYDTYATMTTRALNAEANIIAVSGFGMYRSPFGKDIPPLYPYADGLHGQNVKWDFTAFVPDVVIVNLGTNDGGWINLEPSLTTEEKIRLVKERYVEFLHTLRDTYPDAYILCTIGLLESNATPYVKEAVEMAKEDGMDRLSFFKMSAATSFGAGHPSIDAHKQGAEELTAVLKDILK